LLALLVYTEFRVEWLGQDYWGLLLEEAIAKVDVGCEKWTNPREGKSSRQICYAFGLGYDCIYRGRIRCYPITSLISKLVFEFN
jgi:hypothetical protein